MSPQRRVGRALHIVKPTERGLPAGPPCTLARSPGTRADAHRSEARPDGPREIPPSSIHLTVPGPYKGLSEPESFQP